MSTRGRTFKGYRGFSDNEDPKLVLRSFRGNAWLCIYVGNRIVGSIDSRYTLRMLAESIQKALEKED